MNNEEKPIKKVERVVYFFKKRWASWLFFLIGISITLLFAASLVFDKDIQLQIINNWIGIILGLVATMASIISLFLSFYNLEQERDEARENRELMRELRNMLKESETIQKELKRKIELQAKDTADIRRSLSLENKPIRINDNPIKIKWPDDTLQRLKEISEKSGKYE